MSRKTVYFGLAAFLILSAAIALSSGIGWGQKAPAGFGNLPVRNGSPEQGKTGPAVVNSKAHAMISDFGRVPVFFVPNQGQTDDRIGFYVKGADKTVYFASDGVTFAMNYPARSRNERESERWVVKLDFLGAREDVKPEGVEKTGAVLSYFRGKPKEWKTGLPAYSRIIYRELWPGIDLAYKGDMDKLKYEFIVRPGADPSIIRRAYRGAEKVALTAEGRLEVKTPVGSFEDDIPVAYQEVDGKRAGVHVAYSLEDIVGRQNSLAISGPRIDPEAGPESRTHVYGFMVGEYDRSLTLVLDPAVLVYCGYIGGVNEDGGHAIAVDGSGNVYITGRAFSDASTFPVKVGPDLTPNTGTDAYVAKVDASGTNLAYCGYLGSASPWDDRGVAVDSSGNAYVTGFTSSNQSTFPVKIGPDLTHNGGIDAFIAKVNSAGTDLVYCGYIGGSGDDTCLGIAVDDSGHAYVSGNTFSSQATFPVKVGPDLTYNGDMDAFVARVNAPGTGLDYCGYIGGSGGELASGIAIDSTGSIYVSGHTSSSAVTFPVKIGPSLIYTGGGYVAKVASSGTELVYCGYIAGTWWTNIAVDSSGSAYVTGSANSDLPVLVGPDLTVNGGDDAFVAKVDPSGAALLYCGYIGGSGYDAGSDIAVDNSGNAYVVGGTASTEATFPVVNGPDLTHNGGNDGFIAKVDPSGTALIDCGYIGGSGNDGCGGIAVDDQGNAYVVGGTVSTEATFPVVNGPDLTYNGGGDAFVAKLSTVPGPPITSLLPDSADAGDPGLNLSVIGSDFVNGAVVRWDGNSRTTTFVSEFEVDAEIATADLVAGKTVQVTVRNPDGGVSNALPFTIDNPLPALASLSTTHVTGGGAAFTLTIQGSNFVPNSVVRWNGNNRTTTYVSATELQGAILATDIAEGGEAQVTIFNPAPAGGASGAIVLPVSGFTLGSSPTSVTVTAGQSATYTIQLTPQFGSFD
ncbi:MAG: SBBP repeat-containing protein, partial [Candidatus Aminicenantes bacterium]|nr:SBBP repeat-containing protein [Candidatus Aminicenantes bacterium]